MTIPGWLIEAMGIDSDLVTRGNVAANVYRLAYGGNEGLNLGWVNMDQSTDWIIGIVNNTLERMEELDENAGGITLPEDRGVSWGEVAEMEEDAPNDAIHEIADSSVPIYNTERMAVMVEIDPMGSLPIDPEGVGIPEITGDTTLSELAGNILYWIAWTIAGAIVQARRSPPCESGKPCPTIGGHDCWLTD